MTTYFKVQGYVMNDRVRQIEVNTCDNLKEKLRYYKVDEIQVVATLRSKKDIDALITLLQATEMWEETLPAQKKPWTTDVPRGGVPRSETEMG
jgi:hypothetical protein